MAKIGCYVFMLRNLFISVFIGENKLRRDQNSNKKVMKFK